MAAAAKSSRASARAIGTPDAESPAEETSARKDPRPRPVGGMVHLDLVNKDPRKKYVGVYQGDTDAMMSYNWQGYTPVIFKKGGVAIRGLRTCKEGEPLTYRGHVIMEVLKEDWQAVYDEGQGLADKRATAMQGKRGLSGLGSKTFMPMQNETTALYEEA